MLVLVITFILLISGKCGAVAPTCDEAKCKLPDCFCSGTVPPGGLAPYNIPQIVYLTMSQDAVTDQVYELAINLTQFYRNPNGCPFNLTLYQGGLYDNFFRIEELFYYNRFEIGQRTENPEPPTTKAEWLQQIHSEREILELFANIPQREVRSYQAPRLQINEEMYEALMDDSIRIDHSRPTCQYAKPGDMLFPYTYDYKSIQDCPIGQCPVNSYPGLWEVPLIDFIYPESRLCGCNFIFGCTKYLNASAEQIVDFVMFNFGRHYRYNRAPFGLYITPEWLLGDFGSTHQDALGRILDIFRSLPDVWVVSVSQMIDWMRNPVTKEDAPHFGPWQCPGRRPPRCTIPNACRYDRSTPITMYTCSACPPCYPTPVDPTGQKTPCPPY